MLRLPGPRFVVVDYKTNWLGPIGPAGPEPLTAAHYAAPRLATAMIVANYPLQALLYGVALHRYLRWRLPGYDPRRHLGGVLYLFVRGMCGPDTPVVDGVPCGVFSWAPPPGADRRAVASCWTGGRDDARDRTPAPRTSSPGTPGSPARPPDCSAEFNRAGVLDAADVHVATRVGGLAGERAEPALLALALAVRGLRLGSVCVDLTAVNRTVLGEADELLDVSTLPWPEPAGWLAACRAGPLVADGADAPGGRPLRLVDGLLYLDRYWREEEAVRRSLAERAAAPPPVVDLPRLAGRAAAAVRRRARRRQQRLAAAVGVLRSGQRAGRRSGHREDHARWPGCWRCCSTSPGRRRGWRWPRRPGRPRPGSRRRWPPRCRPGCATGYRRRARCTGCSAAGPAAGDGTQRLPFDVVVVDETSMVSLTDDGPAAGRGPPAGPAGAGRRPRPAGLGGGRRGARRPGPGRRATRTRPGRRAGPSSACPAGCATAW